MAIHRKKRMTERETIYREKQRETGTERERERDSEIE